MKIKPIKKETDYDEALAIISELWNAKESTTEADALEVWVTLVEAYETKHHEIPPPDPVDAIEFYLEQRGLAHKDLEGIIGTRSRVYEIMHRQRSLSMAMVRNLHSQLNIPYECLMRQGGAK